MRPIANTKTPLMPHHSHCDLSPDRPVIAVVFGGASAEHDVSVISATQVMDALDQRCYRVLPIYMDFANRFMTAAHIRTQLHHRRVPSGLEPVSFFWGDDGASCAIGTGGNQRNQRIACVLPVCHGHFGEDGYVQGYFGLLGFPTVGFSPNYAGLAMRKDLCKMIMHQHAIATVADVVVSRAQHAAKGVDWCLQEIAQADFDYPVVIKPCSLGSSIGLGIAETEHAIAPLLEHVLAQDTHAVIEPKIDPLVEYNIAVRKQGSDIYVSAIEQPKGHADLLDFKAKYLSGAGDNKTTTNAAVKAPASQGMLSLTRTLNPALPTDLSNKIHHNARTAFTALGACGAPRIDFLYNPNTNELWFNEINPIPGSYGFFLWQAATPPLLFPELLHALIIEAQHSSIKTFDNPVPIAARLLQT